MGMKAGMEPSEDGAKKLQTVITIQALKGKGDMLVKKLQDVWDFALDLWVELDSFNYADLLRSLVKITGGEGDEAIVRIDYPEGPTFLQRAINIINNRCGLGAELKAVLQAQEPKFSAEVRFGRTVEEMYEDLDSNMFVLPRGVSVKLDSFVTSIVFYVAEEILRCSLGGYAHLLQGIPRSLRGYAHLLQGISKIETDRMEVLYKSEADLGDAFDGIPSLRQKLRDISWGFREGPPALTRPIRGLEEVTKGITSIAVEGLPYGLAWVARFHNLRLTLPLSSIIRGESAMP